MGSGRPGELCGEQRDDACEGVLRGGRAEGVAFVAEEAVRSVGVDDELVVHPGVAQLRGDLRALRGVNRWSASPRRNRTRVPSPAMAGVRVSVGSGRLRAMPVSVSQPG